MAAPQIIYHIENSRMLLVVFLLVSAFALSISGQATSETGATGTPSEQQSDGSNFAEEDQTEEVLQVESFQIPYINSPIHLTSLALSEQSIYQLMVEYEKQLLQRLELVQRYLKDYEESTVIAIQQSASEDTWEQSSIVASYPALIYRLMHRFSIELQAFNEHILQSLESELWESIESVRGNVIWPTEQDLMAASKSMIRIQDTYDFDLRQFTAGILDDLPVQVDFPARQCLEISEKALQLGDVMAATEWFQAAHSKVMADQNGPTSVDDLTAVWEKTYQAFQQIWPMGIFKTPDIFGEAKQYLRDEFQILKMNQTFENREANFKALCRGEILIDTTREVFSCFEDESLHPYFYIAPLKIEVHSLDPLIYQIYDFIGIQSIFQAYEVTSPAIVAAAESGEASELIDDLRTYTHAWIPEDASPVFSKLTAKINMVASGLGMDSSQEKEDYEPFYQLTSFSVGSHYAPCVDCFDRANVETSQPLYKNIRASFHVALLEPMLGGHLVFTVLGVPIHPITGSLIIIDHNLDWRGEVDEEILHGSCPIVAGQKWMLTKLIYE